MVPAGTPVLVGPGFELDVGDVAVGELVAVLVAVGLGAVVVGETVGVVGDGVGALVGSDSVVDGTNETSTK